MPEDSVQADIWKATVEVQRHFNDLELKIRNFALAVLGAFLALGGYAIKEGGFVHIGDCRISVAGLIILGALIPLLAFYLMDRLWYHRLLNGAVKAGAAQEKALAARGYVIDLGSHISTESPITMWLTGWKVHSKHKMDIFYGLLAAAVLGIGLVLGFGVNVPSGTTEVGPASTTVSVDFGSDELATSAGSATDLPSSSSESADTTPGPRPAAPIAID